jgi:hypothetical protein
LHDGYGGSLEVDGLERFSHCSDNEFGLHIEECYFYRPVLALGFRLGFAMAITRATQHSNCYSVLI